MIEIFDVYQTSWALLVPVAIGYTAFRIAYTERIDPQNTTEVFFFTLVFASLFNVCASIMVDILTFVKANFWFALIAKFFVPAVLTWVAAVFWRTRGMKCYANFWRKGLKQSHLDGFKSVTETIVASSYNPQTLLVTLQNDSTFCCSYLPKYNDKPFGPYLLGRDGSIAMYVTHSQAPNNDIWIETDENSREQITVIPADQVRYYEIGIPT